MCFWTLLPRTEVYATARAGYYYSEFDTAAGEMTARRSKNTGLMEMRSFARETTNAYCCSPLLQ